MAGLAQYSPLFENPLFTQTINEIPVQADYIGSRFLPSQDTFDMDWNETVLTRQQDMADIIDSGSELPLTDRDPVRRVSGEIADIGQKYIVTKKELAALMDKSSNGAKPGTKQFQECCATFSSSMSFSVFIQPTTQTALTRGSTAPNNPARKPPIERPTQPMR
jgi:hypothetical protein